jgi:hypothetical protein
MNDRQQPQDNTVVMRDDTGSDADSDSICSTSSEDNGGCCLRCIERQCNCHEHPEFQESGRCQVCDAPLCWACYELSFDIPNEPMVCSMACLLAQWDAVRPGYCRGCLIGYYGWWYLRLVGDERYIIAPPCARCNMNQMRCPVHACVMCHQFAGRVLDPLAYWVG